MAASGLGKRDCGATPQATESTAAAVPTVRASLDAHRSDVLVVRFTFLSTRLERIKEFEVSNRQLQCDAAYANALVVHQAHEPHAVHQMNGSCKR